MFQAKHPGDTLNFKKANGQYHIVLEMALQVFEGKSVKDLVKANAAPKSGAVETQGQKPAQGVNTVPGKTGQILPNIFLQRGFGGLGSFGNSFNKFPAQPKAVAAKSEMDLIDDGWDKIEAAHSQERQKTLEDRNIFDKTGSVSFTLPLEYTTREENAAIIPTVADQLVKLHPLANADKIKKLIRQYGFIGFKKVDRQGRGMFRVELHPTFHKILKMALAEKSATLQS